MSVLVPNAGVAAVSAFPQYVAPSLPSSFFGVLPFLQSDPKPLLVLSLDRLNNIICRQD